MARSKRERYQSERRRIKQLSPEEGSTDGQVKRVLEFLSAMDPKSHAATDPEGGTKSESTIARYANLLYRIMELSDLDLTEASADKLNEFTDILRQGAPEGVKDDGLSPGSVKNYQSTLRRFYAFHGDLGVDKDDIVLLNPDTKSVDERDLYDQEDIRAIRSAAKHPRDRALVDMLLYTGQRISALLNLRLKDINPDDGSFYLNEEAGELKGAAGKRPLLYAAGAVRDWYHDHPCSDPDARFLTHKHEWTNASYGAGDRLDNSTIYRQLQRIGDRAGVDKPMNAHNFRHTFVTLCKRDYGLDNDTIKRLIGHKPGSRIMETTYAHLTDDDVIAAAERATDLRDEEPDSPLTPEVCDICNRTIQQDNAKACPGCGTVFTPDARSVEQQLEEDVKESYKQSDPDDETTQDGIETIDELLQNPELKQALLERMGAD
jgi:integrase/recombinase XerD